MSCHKWIWFKKAALTQVHRFGPFLKKCPFCRLKPVFTEVQTPTKQVAGPTSFTFGAPFRSRHLVMRKAHSFRSKNVPVEWFGMFFDMAVQAISWGDGLSFNIAFDSPSTPSQKTSQGPGMCNQKPCLWNNLSLNEVGQTVKSNTGFSPTSWSNSVAVALRTTSKKSKMKTAGIAILGAEIRLKHGRSSNTIKNTCLT